MGGFQSCSVSYLWLAGVHTVQNPLVSDAGGYSLAGTPHEAKRVEPGMAWPEAWP